jgi:hypothetical protein
MKECIPMLISKEVIEPSIWAHEYLKRYPNQKLHKPVKIDLPKKISIPLDNKLVPNLGMYFLKMVLGSTVPKKYCRSIPKKSIEKCIFEFANRIGMYITYILSQALYPVDLETLQITRKQRAELATTLITKSIDTEEIFDAFRQLITELGLAHCDLKINEHRQLYQLTKENFETLSTQLRCLYPKIYDGLENWWFNSNTFALKVNSSLAAISGCPHQWSKIYVFKYGSCNFCTKCRALSTASNNGNEPRAK